MLNQCIFGGNLTADPELKSLASGKKVVNFTVAVNETYKGEKQAVFIRCEAWDSGAETIEKWFKKGDPIFVIGSLRQEEWEKDGVKRTAFKLRVREFKFAPGKKRDEEVAGGDEDAAPAPKKTPVKSKSKKVEADDGVDLPSTDEEIPF